MANPALKESVFREASLQQMPPGVDLGTEQMTLDGTVQKTGFLFVLLFAAAYFGWIQVTPNKDKIELPGFVFPAMIAALVVALITIFRPQSARITAPLYAIAEGFVLGAISAACNLVVKGAVVQALLLTGGVFATMLILFASGKLRATPRFKKMVIAATFGIFLAYMVSALLSLFGHPLGFVAGFGAAGIIFSLFVVAIAALNLVIDFDFIATNSNTGAPKYLEWYGGFGLMVTVVWLYIEILNLIMRLNRN